MLRELAGTIWRQHYAAIISAAQIDFMLAGRFSDEALRGHVQAAERWLELLRVAGTPVGYCGFEVASMVLTAVENGGAGRSKMVALGGVDLP